MRWDTAPLGLVADVRPSGVDKLTHEDETPVLLCNYTDVYYADAIDGSRDFMAASATSDEIRRFTLQRDDVALTKDSETPDDIGVPTWVAEDLPGVLLGYHTSLARPRPVDGRFLYYALSSDPTKAYYEQVARGVTRYALRQQDVASTPVPVPPLKVQRRIADYLDTETARIDTLIAKNEHAATLVDERASSDLNAHFGASIIEDATGTPVGLEGLPTRPLFTLATVQSGLTKNAADEDRSAPEWGYLRVANVQDGRLDLSEIKTVHVPETRARRHQLQPGDVLMTEGGDPDKLGRGTVFRGEVERCLHQNHVFAVRPRTDVVLPDYLALATRSAYARVYFEKTSSKTTGIASTSSRKIGEWRAPCPTLEVQAEVVRRASLANDATTHLLGRLHDQRELLHERRQALITAAVTGDIEV